MMKKFFGIVGLVLVGLCGCGGGDPAGPDPAAVSKCHDLVAVVCARIVTCDSSTSNDACVSAVASSLDCGGAIGVSSSYDRCTSEIGGFDCAVLDGGNTLPASCDKVIKVAAK